MLGVMNASISRLEDSPSLALRRAAKYTRSGELASPSDNIVSSSWSSSISTSSASDKE